MIDGWQSSKRHGSICAKPSSPQANFDSPLLPFELPADGCFSLGLADLDPSAPLPAPITNVARTETSALLVVAGAGVDLPARTVGAAPAPAAEESVERREEEDPTDAGRWCTVAVEQWRVKEEG